MLSYMLPVDEKPPPGPGKARLQLSLGSNSTAAATAPTATTAPTYATAPNGRPSPISKETSVSSLASDVTTATVTSVATATGSATPSSDRGKVKPSAVNGKHPSLKRVSFGSSKGSMVETLIFESPVQEEPEPSPVPENGVPHIPEQDPTEAEREKVRVTFFQQSKPLEVDLPDEPVFIETDFIMASPVTMNETNHVIYNRTESVESGWENPFRPGGDLSREADEIVELIKGGKPITPTPGQAPSIPNDQLDGHHQQNSLHSNQEPVTQSPKKASQLNSTPKSANGTTKVDAKPGAVDVQRTTLKPQGNVQVEHVNIKKKPKCKCCVIQ